MMRIESKLRFAPKWLALGALALLAAGCGAMGPGASAASGEQHPLLGAAAPPFELPSPDAKKKVSLAAQSGKVVVVDFWATWCAPCRQSFPVYERLSEKYGGKVVVIGISVDEAPGGIAGFAKETGAKFPLAWDDGQIASKSYQPPTMPTSYVVDTNGIVRFVHSGFHSGEEREIDAELASLLK